MSTDVALPDPPEGLDDERAVQIARAYQLHVVKGYILGDVATMMGISRTQVWRFVQEGRAQAALMPWMAREEVRLQHHLERQAMRAWLHAEVEVKGISALEGIPILLKIQERAAAEHGLDAGAPVGSGGSTPNPRVIEALRNIDQEDDPL